MILCIADSSIFTSMKIQLIPLTLLFGVLGCKKTEPLEELTPKIPEEEKVLYNVITEKKVGHGSVEYVLYENDGLHQVNHYDKEGHTISKINFYYIDGSLKYSKLEDGERFAN